MAELFLARTTGPEGFEKLVVLKKILPSHAENPKFVRLFLDEAKLVATLDHPHIAHVYDMGKVDGDYFFTMEYVHGQDVRTTLRRAERLDYKFPIEHAVLLGRNIASALHYAHERRRDDDTLLGVVHRDVSPSNILLSYEGAVKLVDFGVAKAATSTQRTRTGTLKGKISYMSPEQAKGAPIDRRSDIFSLGIVLWELVTRQRLFKADNDLATIQMIINSNAPRPSELRPDCPEELERILMRALAKEVEERYQTAEQLQLDLEELVRAQKLDQSTVALREFMHELFEDEIRAWSHAQAAGQTLTEHLIDCATEMTTPVSESELYSLDAHDVDDDEDEDDGRSTIQPPPAVNGRHEMAVPAPPQVANVTAPAVVGDPPPTGELTAVQPDPEAVVESAMLDEEPATPSPFPPAEWQAPDANVHLDLDKGPTKRVLIASSIGFGAAVLLVAAFIARDPQPAAKANEEPRRAPNRIEMKSAPSAGATTTPAKPALVEEAPAVAPDPAVEEPVVAPAVEAPKPKPKPKKPATKPPGTTTKPAQEPARPLFDDRR